jgi:hypothetical protein
MISYNEGLITTYDYERYLNHELSKLSKLVFIGVQFSYNKCRNGESPYIWKLDVHHILQKQRTCFIL